MRFRPSYSPLPALGFPANCRMLRLERLSHDRIPGEQALGRLQQHSALGPSFHAVETPVAEYFGFELGCTSHLILLPPADSARWIRMRPVAAVSQQGRRIIPQSRVGGYLGPPTGSLRYLPREVMPRACAGLSSPQMLHGARRFGSPRLR